MLQKQDQVVTTEIVRPAKLTVYNYYLALNRKIVLIRFCEIVFHRKIYAEKAFIH